MKGENHRAGDLNLDDPVGENANKIFGYVDWSKTRAYALGLGQIYINLKHREPLGIVPQEEYEATCREIKERLATLVDHRWKPWGDPVVEYVKARAEMWDGAYANDNFDAPDLQVGFKPGYRVSWRTCLGGISTEERMIEDNLERWSGDHCSVAGRYVPGVFFCNHTIERENPRIIDIAPTVLSLFDLNPPEMMEGVDLFSR